MATWDDFSPTLELDILPVRSLATWVDLSPTPLEMEPTLDLDSLPEMPCLNAEGLRTVDSEIDFVLNTDGCEAEENVVVEKLELESDVSSEQLEV